MSFKGGSPCLSVPDCGICPVIEKDVGLFLFGTPEEYVDYVAEYEDDPEVLESTESIKQCVDSTLTDEDKQNAAAVIVSPCVSGEGRGLCFSPTLKLLCEPRNGTHLIEDVRRMGQEGTLRLPELSQARVDPSRSGPSISLSGPDSQV